jgi:hypothetical protein
MHRPLVFLQQFGVGKWCCWAESQNFDLALSLHDNNCCLFLVAFGCMLLVNVAGICGGVFW